MDGIIIINKSKGPTSHDIVYHVKKAFNEKVGHTGTLDPLATGVLPLLIGKGTQCAKYLINHDKTYQVQLQLGKKSDTGDSEGKIIEEKEVTLNLAENQEFIKQTLKRMLGKQKQIPPIYSAIKVNGKKLYEYARKGQTVEIQPREIEIYEINLLKVNNQSKQIELQVSCSKGTYIRSLCEDIAEKLGTIGYMSELNRIQVGNFNISDSITLKELQENKELVSTYFITIERLFENNTSIKLEENKLQLFLNGVKLTNKNEDGVYKIYCKDKFIGIGIIKNNLLKRDIIL